MANHLDGIAQIAANTTRPEKLTSEQAQSWSGQGFLTSGFSLQAYRNVADECELYALLEDGRPVSFLMAYGQEQEPMPDDFVSTFIRRTVEIRAVIIKQIATVSERRRCGYATVLYKHFIETHSANIYAAIVKMPPNLASEAFHKNLNFEECAIFNHPDGMVRSIWRRATDELSARDLAEPI
jgi:predicted GNAT superfamily acetyltransferase